MKNLYVFNVNTRGAMYGIGTYIEQLAKCSIKKDMNVYIVEINASCEEFKVETKMVSVIYTFLGHRFIRRD